MRTMNLGEWGEIFSASCMFANVAAGIDKIIGGIRIEEAETGQFKDTGELWGEMDWNTHYAREKNPKLSVKATTLRPYLFEAWEKMNAWPDEQRAEGIYRLLASGGEDIRLDEKGLRQTRETFQRMADDTLTFLQYSRVA